MGSLRPTLRTKVVYVANVAESVRVHSLCRHVWIKLISVWSTSGGQRQVN